MSLTHRPGVGILPTEELVSYVARPNAPLTPGRRRKLVELVFTGGWVQARVAERLQVSRATVSKWGSRYRLHGAAGLADRSLRPHNPPNQPS